MLRDVVRMRQAPFTPTLGAYLLRSQSLADVAASSTGSSAKRSRATAFCRRATPLFPSLIAESRRGRTKSPEGIEEGVFMRFDILRSVIWNYVLAAPVHQMQQYYRLGNLDNCSDKWSALYDCLSLKTKRQAEVEEILEKREKTKPHIWSFRTPEEAASHWQKLYGHMHVYEDE
nr:uncharacterized protein C227.17C-like [Ipomoea batatas]